MREIFQKGSCKIYEKRVSALDLATFESGTVHEVYSTFALTRDAEWSGRLFVLEMKEEDEEGIGTQINLKHLAPAFVGELLTFTAFFDEISDKGEIITSFTVQCGERLVATGTQGQKIFKKAKIEAYFASFER